MTRPLWLAQRRGAAQGGAKRGVATRSRAQVVSNQPTREPRALGWVGWGQVTGPLWLAARRVAKRSAAKRRGAGRCDGGEQSAHQRTEGSGVGWVKVIPRKPLLLDQLSVAYAR